MPSDHRLEGSKDDEEKCGSSLVWRNILRMREPQTVTALQHRVQTSYHSKASEMCSAVDEVRWLRRCSRL